MDIGAPQGLCAKQRYNNLDKYRTRDYATNVKRLAVGADQSQVKTIRVITSADDNDARASVETVELFEQREGPLIFRSTFIKSFVSNPSCPIHISLARYGFASDDTFVEVGSGNFSFRNDTAGGVCQSALNTSGLRIQGAQ